MYIFHPHLTSSLWMLNGLPDCLSVVLLARIMSIAGDYENSILYAMLCRVDHINPPTIFGYDCQYCSSAPHLGLGATVEEEEVGLVVVVATENLSTS